MLIPALITAARGVGDGGCYVWHWPGLGHALPPSNETYRNPKRLQGVSQNWNALARIKGKG